MMNKILKRVWAVFKIIITVIIIALVAILFIPRLFGMKPLVVLSGSMEPTYHVGSLIYVENIEVEDIKVGDALTYEKNMGSGVSNVTHRVVRIDNENEVFYTKGDANGSEDSIPTSFSNIVGKPAFTIPYLGYFAVFMGTQMGKIIGLTVIAILLIIFFLPDYLMKKEKLKREL